MSELEDESIRQLREDLENDLRVHEAKTKIVEVLAALPDDDTRRRVIGAVAVLQGFADVLMKRDIVERLIGRLS